MVTLQLKVPLTFPLLCKVQQPRENLCHCNLVEISRRVSVVRFELLARQLRDSQPKLNQYSKLLETWISSLVIHTTSGN